jgi:hypothetical protein
VNSDQVSGLFGAGEAFVEGTIAAALVILWILSVALHLARPYMARTTGKFTLRLGADLWWIIYTGLRDIMLLQVFLGSFIFFYPDVVKAQQLPITGGLAAVFAFAALILKLMGKGDEDVFWMRVQVILIGIGAALYLTPYMFGPQATLLTGSRLLDLSTTLTTSSNPGLALPLCYISAALTGLMGLFAVGYNWRLSMTRRPSKAA